MGRHRNPSIRSGIDHQFPLRPDITILLANIPRDLKTSEVERLAAFIRSLASDAPAAAEGGASAEERKEAGA